MSGHEFINPLYHGTISLIDKVDVTRGHDRKDFGKGFYISTSKRQAVGMMHKKYKEAVRRNRNNPGFTAEEYLYEIIISTDYAAKLNVKVFKYADEEWLDFILKCREQGGTPHDYDLVIGPTADDDTMYCLRAYWDGMYGSVGSSAAKKVLLDNLEPENLGVQYFVSNQSAADGLIMSLKQIDWR